MADNLPLSGLKIVVTRPREQATQLAQGIEKLGGLCIPFPLLEISPLADSQSLNKVAARLHEFQIAIFISPNAVRFAMEIIRREGGLPPSLQIATVGSGSARELHHFGVTTVIAPQHKFDSESLLALPEMLDVSGKRVVIFRGDTGRELLGDTLKQRGASVEYAACYHRGKTHLKTADLLDSKPDAICLSSSEALVHLEEMLTPTDKTQLLPVTLFASHERIAVAAQTLGWQNIVIANGGDEGLLLKLVPWAAQKRGTE